eukprot:TRINITY_DN6153_c0_g1_i2.p1 TRINITY_DN6153_c0_g1~~TRINITY_DN6153_c0_g1_i2.p1  ORF type:complete len:612 (+),score=87.54 TRINITY_DN6153_c0_g1_i2:83-1918(+)
MQRCAFCGATELISDKARGDVVCGQCGELLKEGELIADVTFGSSGSGAATLAGQNVSWSGHGNATGCLSEDSISRGLTKIGWLADQLNLNSRIQESGGRMFRLAASLQFIRGRPTRFVACACLYVICRQNKSPHLLMDFSGVLGVSVKILGRVYMRLLKRLVGGDPASSQFLGDTGVLDVPLIDPSIFIERYSRKLSLGPKTQRVQNTAKKLILFMRRDWITLGRRPNGLVGAALLIASFFHSVKCSAKDIADIVRIGEDTIRLRLTEMRHTPLALMNKSDFETTDPTKLQIEDSDRPSIPPCLRKERRQKAWANAIEDAVDLEDEACEVTGRAKRRKVIHKRSVDARTSRKFADPRGKSGPDYGGEAGVAATQQSPVLPLASSASTQATQDVESAATGLSDSMRMELYTATMPSTAELHDVVTDILGPEAAQIVVQSSGSSNADAIVADTTADVATARIEELLASADEMEATLNANASAAAVATASFPPLEKGDDSDGCTETLSDVDDAELDELYLLDDEERQHKSDIWHEVNKDYLEEWHVRGREIKRRNAEKAASAADSASSQGSSRRRASRYPQAGSPSHSAAMALARQGKVSANRINLDALDSLFD